MSGRTPAWGLDSVVLRVPDLERGVAPTPEWVFGDSTGAGVRVAVVDSGIEADHPALGRSVDRDGGVVVTVDDDGHVAVTPGPHDDVYGHGTACAGIIHALAPDAAITSVRVLGPDLTGRAAAFHAGLSWAVDEGFDVINLSLGTTKAEWALAFHELCDRAYFGGSFVVTAANNIRRTSYPSLFSSVASVACTTTRDPLRFHVNPAPPTEFLARGIDIEVPWRGGTTTTTTGNSFAAPHIAGLAALIKGEHPRLRPFQVKALLWATAGNVREAAATGTAVDDGPGAPAAPVRRGTAEALTQVVRLPPAASLAAPPTPAAPGTTSSTWTVGGYEAVGAARRTPWGVAVPARRGDQSVVIHDLRPSTDDDGERDAIVAAVRLASGLVHPHLEPVIEVVRPDGPLVVVADARPLAEVASPLPTADALAVALALLSGLDALHRHGLVHGDVRADGATVDGRGAARLGWSGIAAIVDRPPLPTGQPAHQVRALVHLAPERLDGAAPTPAADVYGVALILATLLRGEAPFVAVDDGDALRHQRASSAPTLLGPGRAPLHADLEAALARALAPDPGDRPGDAATFATVLGWVAHDIGLEVGPGLGPGVVSRSP
ncbi:MAG TPA: S8 family serine peptidase [Iamia sp.]